MKYYNYYIKDLGDVYVIGVNRFGQLGQSNLNLALVSEPIKIEFPDDKIKIKAISIGDNHNLMLSEGGELYGNGDNSLGQINGNTDNFLYYFCTPQLISFKSKDSKDDEKISNNGKILKFKARNNRSCAFFENGIVLYWGGFSYHPKFTINSLPIYDGNYNLKKI